MGDVRLRLESHGERSGEFTGGQCPIPGPKAAEPSGPPPKPNLTYYIVKRQTLYPPELRARRYWIVALGTI